MEAKVHNDLSKFLTRHNLKDSISQIDSIVLSYLIGILELIGQGEVEDCFDLEDVMEMMNAYLPGFDQISRDSVLRWMFDLAANLQRSDTSVSECPEVKTLASDEGSSDRNETLQAEANVHNEDISKAKLHSTFPSYDYMYCHENNVALSNFTSNCGNRNGQHQSNGDAVSSVVPSKTKSMSEKNGSIISGTSPSSPPSCNSGITASMVKQEKQRRKSGSKRKERYLSCSSQESQEDSSKYQIEIQVDSEDSHVCSLLEMFPAACSMEASHCLQLSNGDLDLAAQLIMDRQETGQAITITHSKCYQKKDRKMKKTSDYKLDDDSIKSTVLERYSFIDTEEDKRTHKPPPLKNEAKKLVRYRDGQIVSLKGERFSEVKKASSEDSSKK